MPRLLFMARRRAQQAVLRAAQEQEPRGAAGHRAGHRIAQASTVTAEDPHALLYNITSTNISLSFGWTDGEGRHSRVHSVCV
jgi:hypothetical protein